ncbi:MAG: 16S rRNA (guanine(527)-N(7))-methyltransferase RsmG [Desulfobulbaceae bacterium]|nr:16S rRNA (guanine(527)-N(7))-methyltransferase RsmG [Desulfobulbaceae bacterium]
MNGGHEKYSRQAAQFFTEGLSGLDLALTDEQVVSLIRYCLELRKWNKKVNLVARNTSLRDLIDKHFFDSLTLVPLLRKFDHLSGPLLDVGSGAGFPGLVVKIACPSLAVMLLEPRHRRATFLKHVIRLLALKKTEVHMRRTEDADFAADSDFAFITGRAVAEVCEFLAMVEHLAAPKTLVICMQGEGGSERWEKQENPTAFQFIGVEKTMLPLSGAGRHLLLFRKSP